jgi:hypothetical protein
VRQRAARWSFVMSGWLGTLAGMQAAELMTRFAERTGLTSDAPQRRYLWTDAFAVCNFLGLARATGEERWRERAGALVETVHRALGRHRADDARRGWISGLPEAEGELHPTAGGLRIGKPLPERAANEPVDERREWDRDGQYFHYLTKWMHALDRVARELRQARFARFASELADAAHRRFLHGARGHRRMYWKMSIDLSRPQVATMGQHDPLDGYVTCVALEATREQLRVNAPGLRDAIAEYRALIDPGGLATADPLGIGGLLVDAYRLARLDRDPALRDALLAAADTGLAHYLAQPDLRRPAERRLAFRELGLAIGLVAARELGAAAFVRHADVRHRIESFWLEPRHHASSTWREHADINDVMLATSLAPAGFLGLAS